MATWQVGTYRLYQYAGRTSGTKYVIRLEEASGGSGYALHAYFQTTSPLPANSVSGTFYFLYFPTDMFEPMVDMLREEKPCWVYAPDAINTYIGTSNEPAGEDEGP